MDEEKRHDHNEEDCGCGCGDCGCGECDCENEPVYVELEDENGNVVSCEVVDDFQYNNSDFLLVQNPQDDSVYLFKVVGEGEESELVIPEDEEFEAASKYYESLLEKEE